MSGLSGGAESRVLVALGLGLDLSAVGEQQVDYFIVTERGCEDERGESLLVAVLDVRALLDEQLAKLLVTTVTRDREGRVVVALGRRVQIDVRVVVLRRFVLHRLLDEVGCCGREWWRRRWQPVRVR